MNVALSIIKKSTSLLLIIHEKAFNQVSWTTQLEILERVHVDWRDRRLINALCIGQTVTVRLNVGESEPDAYLVEV